MPLPPETGYVTGVVLGTLRNDSNAWVGMQVVVGANPLTVTQLGRIMAPGNSGTHTVKLVHASDGTAVAMVAISMSGGTVGQFQYGSLSSPVTLAAGTAYYVVSQETAGGDSWYNYDTQVTTTGVAVDNAVVWGTDPGALNIWGLVDQAMVPVDFKYTTAAPPDFYCAPENAAITWTDKNGENMIASGLASFLASADFASVTAVQVSNQSLTILSGLAALPALTYLNCSNNSLTTLDVSSNTVLVNLYCGSGNALTVLSVNTILTDLVAFGHTGGTLDTRNQIPAAPPSVGPPNGIVAKAALLAELPPWTVTTD